MKIFRRIILGVALYCPRDRTELRIEILTNIHLGYCPNCHGTWYFGDSLVKLLSLEKFPSMINLSRNLFKQEKSELTCPLCLVEMDGKVFKHDKGLGDSVEITIDQCCQCHGVWFDQGELPKTRQFIRYRMNIMEQEAAAKRMLAMKSIVKNPDISSVSQNRFFRAYPVPKSDVPLPRIIKPLPQFQFEEERDEKAEAKELGEGVAMAQIEPQVWLFAALTNLPVEVYNPPRKRFPYMTLSIIVICTFIHLIATLLGNLDTVLTSWGASVSQHWITLLSCLFLHGSWLHLLGNMYFLWVFGDNVEDRMGPFLFTLFYLMAGILSSIFQIQYMGDASVLVGASGAIAGVMGAYLYLFPRSALYQVLFLFFPIKIPVYFYFGIWLFLQWLGNYMKIHSIGFIAHISGFIIGFAFVVVWYVVRNMIKHPKHF